MKSLSKVLVIGIAVIGLAGTSAPAFADPPGPGDKQCIPGLNGPPQPAKKGGSC